MQHHKLSDREKEVLHLVAQEYTTPQIARLLYRSSHTIDSHKKNLKNKLNVKNSAGMVRKGFELGLLQIAASSAAQVLLLIFAISILSVSAEAQNEFEIRTDGIVVPRTTTAEVSNPVEGQLIYDTTTDDFRFYDGTAWQSIGSGGTGGSGAFEREGGVVRQSSPNDNSDDFLFGRQIAPMLGQSIQDTLLFFDQSMGAFYGGYMSELPLEDTIGRLSFGFGNRVKAAGENSTAFGSRTEATGERSAAFGFITKASGVNSTAFGSRTEATGERSAAFGFITKASGVNSTAFGSRTEASGMNSTTFGSSTRATGENSTAFGSITEASGPRSVAFGIGSMALGDNSIASGSGSMALANESIAHGFEADAKGFASTAFGIRNDAHASACTVVGQYNDTLVTIGYNLSDSPLFIVGNGLSASNRTNALVVRKDGEVSFENYTFPIQNGTNGQVLTTDGIGQLSWNTLQDSDPTNEIQSLSLSSNTLSLSDGGGSLSLTSYLDNTDDWSNSGSNIHFTTGDIGIGTIDPEATVQIEANSSRTDPLLTLYHDGSSFVRQAYANNTADEEKWYILAQPQQANNTANAFFRIFYTDSNGVADWETDTGINVFDIDGKGNATLAGTLTENSDIRLKKNFTPLTDALSSLSQIHGYRYQWKNRINKDDQIGLIAQEVQSVYPELISENEEGMLSVSYTKMVPILLEAIKEQQVQIQDQGVLINELINRIDQLED